MGAELAVVTMGADGAVMRGACEAELPAPEVDVVSTLGAGDASWARSSPGWPSATGTRAAPTRRSGRRSTPPPRPARAGRLWVDGASVEVYEADPRDLRPRRRCARQSRPPLAPFELVRVHDPRPQPQALRDGRRPLLLDRPPKWTDAIGGAGRRASRPGHRRRGRARRLLRARAGRAAGDHRLLRPLRAFHGLGIGGHALTAAIRRGFELAPMVRSRPTRSTARTPSPTTRRAGCGGAPRGSSTAKRRRPRAGDRRLAERSSEGLSRITPRMGPPRPRAAGSSP